MELSFDDYCLIDSSPTTVLPLPRRLSKVSNRKPSEKPKHRNHRPILNNCFIEINLSTFSTASCRDGRFHRVGCDEENGEPLKTKAVVGREKIDYSGGTTQSALGIINSLCSMDADSKNQTEFCTQDFTTLSESVAATANEAYQAAILQKSLSLLLTLSRSPGKSESDGSQSSSPKSRVGKMLRPFVKSKSHRSPLSGPNESSILDKPPCNLFVHNSATHLHGVLRFENKHGEPFFEFLVKSTEDVYVGKMHTVEEDGTQMYTLHRRRKSNAGGWGFNDGYRESSMVGQMRVSCRMRSEFDGDGEMDDSLVMKFVLYDVAHSRKGSSSGDYVSCSPDVGRAHSPPDFNQILFNDQLPLDSQPVAAADLCSEIEIGAVITQVPLGKRGVRREGKMMDGSHTPPYQTEQWEAMEGACVTSHPPKMHVVIPTGNHAWPVADSGGPSPLIDRWRLGGGCDCGGWDMACPLVVFTNQTLTINDCQPLKDCRNLAQLFVQGKKENTAAFDIWAMEDGKYYAVDFHARLSSLQALFMCMAVLHTAETSRALVNEPSFLHGHGNPSRLFTEDKIPSRTDSAASKEVKSKVNRKIEEAVLPSSFVLNPPFSPVARV